MHSFFTLCNSPSLRAVKTSFTPFLARAFAVCSPIPLDAPVIKTTFPLSFSAECNFCFTICTYKIEFSTYQEIFQTVSKSLIVDHSRKIDTKVSRDFHSSKAQRLSKIIQINLFVVQKALRPMALHYKLYQNRHYNTQR